MRPLKTILFLLVFGIATLSFSQDVFTTKTGEKYHKETCRYLSKSKYRMGLKDALAYGYDPCSVCKPPTRATSGKSQVSHFSSNQSSSRVSKSSSSSATPAAARLHRVANLKRDIQLPQFTSKTPQRFYRVVS